MKFLFSQFAVGLLILFFCTSNYAVSRVGNNQVVDELLGFKAQIPERFVYSKRLPENGIGFLDTQLPFIGPSMVPSQLEIAPSRLHYNDLDNLTRSQFRDFFLEAEDASWSVIEDLKSSCMEGFVASVDNSSTAVIFWGKGKGISLYLGSSRISELLINRIVQSIEIFEGACSW